MLRYNNKFNFSLLSLVKIKKLTSFKMCYKNTLSFLKYKITLSNSLSNRLVIRSQYLRSYKNLRAYYLYFLRANFTENLNPQYKSFLINNKDNKKFLLAYASSKMMNELDNVLLWRGAQFNPLFDMKFSLKKKKKKLTIDRRVHFIHSYKRLLFVWKWLAIFIRCLSTKDLKKMYSLIKGFENFLLVSDDNHMITEVKLQIYKTKLFRLQ